MERYSFFSNYFAKKLAKAFFMLLAVIMVGVFGYEILEDKYTFIDSFYMTIITISTVGFKEIHPLSDAGKLFTSGLIISSFGIFAYSVTTITSYIMSGDYRKRFIEDKMLKEINKLKGHVIVCGYGRVGQQTVKDLLAHDEQVLVMENDENLIERLAQNKALFYLKGDATDEINLELASILSAKALITTLPSDSDNMFVVLTAREMCEKTLIISRASNPRNAKKLKIAGAENVIMPDTVGGAHMASLVVTPDVIEFLDHISIQGAADVNLEEVSFYDMPEELKNLSIKELDARNKLGVNIIGFKTSTGDYIINPSPDTILEPNSKLFVLGTQRQINLLNKVFKFRTGFSKKRK
jgi:voltage-gated potassium channel